MSSKDERRGAEAMLRQLLRSGRVDLPPATSVSAALGARGAESLPDTVHTRLLRTVRTAGVDRKMAAAHGGLRTSRSFCEHLRTTRSGAKISVEELATRLGIPAHRLRAAEHSAAALLSWPASAVGDVLQLLNFPLQTAVTSAQADRDPFGAVERTPYRMAASMAENHDTISPPVFTEAARILRELGRDDLLVAG